jgi:hypothetical protein
VGIDNERVLHRRWVHSHEEDTETELVFRPDTYSFPPSRGRRSFELRRDGTYRERGPGPADAPEESAGRWLVEEGRLFLHGEHGRPGEAFEVVSAADDILRLRR